MRRFMKKEEVITVLKEEVVDCAIFGMEDMVSVGKITHIERENAHVFKTEDGDEITFKVRKTNDDFTEFTTNVNRLHEEGSSNSSVILNKNRQRVMPTTMMELIFDLARANEAMTMLTDCYEGFDSMTETVEKIREELTSAISLPMEFCGYDVEKFFEMVQFMTDSKEEYGKILGGLFWIVDEEYILDNRITFEDVEYVDEYERAVTKKEGNVEYSVLYDDCYPNGSMCFHAVRIKIKANGETYEVYADYEEGTLQHSSTMINHQDVMTRHHMDMGYTFFSMLKKEIKKVVVEIIEE